MSNWMQRTVILSYGFQNRTRDKDVVKKGQENQNSVENTIMKKKKNLDLKEFLKDFFSKFTDQIWAKHPDRKPGVEPMLKLMVEPTSSDEELLNIG